MYRLTILLPDGHAIASLGGQTCSMRVPCMDVTMIPNDSVLQTLRVGKFGLVHILVLLVVARMVLTTLVQGRRGDIKATAPNLYLRRVGVR